MIPETKRQSVKELRKSLSTIDPKLVGNVAPMLDELEALEEQCGILRAELALIMLQSAVKELANFLEGESKS